MQTLREGIAFAFVFSKINPHLRLPRFCHDAMKYGGAIERGLPAVWRGAFLGVANFSSCVQVTDRLK